MIPSAYRVLRYHDKFIPQWLESAAPWWRFWSSEPAWQSFWFDNSYGSLVETSYSTESEALSCIEQRKRRLLDQPVITRQVPA